MFRRDVDLDRDGGGNRGDLAGLLRLYRDLRNKFYFQRVLLSVCFVSNSFWNKKCKDFKIRFQWLLNLFLLKPPYMIGNHTWDWEVACLSLRCSGRPD